MKRAGERMNQKSHVGCYLTSFNPLEESGVVWKVVHLNTRAIRSDGSPIMKSRLICHSIRRSKDDTGSLSFVPFSSQTGRVLDLFGYYTNINENRWCRMVIGRFLERERNIHKVSFKKVPLPIFMPKDESELFGRIVSCYQVLP